MITIYTDGACIPNPGAGGWGLVAYDEIGDRIFENWGGKAQTTNNIMEMTAIVNALVFLNGREGIVYSDSQYCIKGLNEWRAKWKRHGWRKGPNSSPVANAELWQELDAWASASRATFKWVKGHNGNAGNERADELAERAWQMTSKRSDTPAIEAAE